MGTRGLYAYKHRGIYYVVYNHWDSYPDGLGNDLVALIPVDEEEFQVWLEKQRQHFDNEAKRLAALDEDPSVHLDMSSMNAYHGYLRKPSTKAPEKDLLIEWTYTFDLDRLAFIVDEMVPFRLNNIPRAVIGNKVEWISYIVDDASGTRCISFDTPKEYVADLSLPSPPPSADGLSTYENCKAHILDLSDWKVEKLDASQGLAVSLAKAFIRWNWYRFSTVPGLTPDDPAFRQLAIALLYAASPSLPCFLSADELKQEDENGPQYRCRNALDIKTPSSDIFWYRQHFVKLTSHLDKEDNLKSAIGDLLVSLREMGVENGDGVLWSVLHIVTVHIASGTVSHSKAIPIEGASGSDYPEGLVVLARCLSYDARNHDQEQKSADGKIQNEILPPEILSHVLEYTDAETYSNCAELSRTWRAHCLARPRIGSYMLLGCEDSDKGIFIAQKSNEASIRVKIFWNKKMQDRSLIVLAPYKRKGYTHAFFRLRRHQWPRITVMAEDEKGFEDGDNGERRYYDYE